MLATNSTSWSTLKKEVTLTLLSQTKFVNRLVNNDTMLLDVGLGLRFLF